MDMNGPEQFIYFLLLLTFLCGWAANNNVSIRDVYIDVGCRLVKTWQRYVLGHPNLPSSFGLIRIMVNWMHGSSHDIGCQLENNARYQDGAGWKVGESSEQLWSLLKVRGIGRMSSWGVSSLARSYCSVMQGSRML